ncbi:MAG: hypothetical protein HQL20_01005 [Candidatus Omnitrophica bacterium]|nr:hypothetical protein [Candidatus Omnitrophota bacterium]
MNSHLALRVVAGMILAAGVLLSCSTAQAASRYWVGANGANTNDANNWAGADPASCAGGGAGIPGNSDIAYFDADCDSNASINANLNVAGINIASGYSGTITQTSTYTVTVGASHYTQVDGTFTGGSGAITNSGNFSVTGGAFTATSGTLSVAGDVNLSGGTYTHNNGIIDLTKAAGTQTFDSGNQTFYRINHNAAGTLQLINNSVTATNYIYQTAGTIDLNTLSMTSQGNGRVRYGGILNNGTFTVSGLTGNQVTIDNNAVIGANIYITAGSINFTDATFNGVAFLNCNGTTQGDSVSYGGSTFNSDTTLQTSGSVQFYTSQSKADTFNGPLTLNNTSNGTLTINWAGNNTKFNNNIYVNNTGSGTVSVGAYYGSSMTLADGYTISVGSSGVSSGTLSIKGLLQAGTTAQNIALTGTATMNISYGGTFNGDLTVTGGTGNTVNTYSTATRFNGNLNVTAGIINLNGGTFNGTSYFKQTGTTSDSGGSSGSCTFNSTTTIENNGSRGFSLGYSTTDTFNGPLTLTNTSSGYVNVVSGTSGTVFNNDIFFNNTGAGTTSIGNYNGTRTSTLADGHSLSIGTTGFSSGTLAIRGLTQVGSTGSTLDLTGTSSLVMNYANTFNGPLTISTPVFNLGRSTFNGPVTITKTGLAGSYTYTDGGDTFNSTFTFNQNGTGSGGGATSAYQYLGNNGLYETFNGDVTFNILNNSDIGLNQTGYKFNGNLIVNSSGSGNIYIYNSTLATGKTISVGTGYTGGELRLQGFNQVGATAQNLTMGGTSILTLGTGTTFNGDTTFSVYQTTATSVTFNGATTFEATKYWRIYGSTFNGPATMNNPSTNDWSGFQNTATTFNNDVTFTTTGNQSSYVAFGVNTIFNGNVTGANRVVWGNGGIPVFSKTSGVQTLDTANIAFSNLTHSGAGALQLTGNNLRMTNGTALINSAGTLDLNGRNITAVSTTFTLTNSGGNIQLINTETTNNFTQYTSNGTWTYVGNGTATTRTIKDFGATDYFNLSINATGATPDVFQITSPLNLVGALRVQTPFTPGTYLVTLSGATASYTSTNIDISKTTWTGGSLNIQSDLDQTLPSGETYGTLQLGRFSGTGGTIFNMGSTIEGNWTVDADATVNLTGDLVISGSATINGRVNTQGWNLTIAGTLDMNGTLDATRGATASTITLSGSADFTGGTFTRDNSVLLFNGTGTKTLKSASNTFNTLQVNNAGLTLSMQDSLLVGGDLTLTAGTLDVTASNYAISAAGTWTNAGGTFTPRNGTVTLNGASQRINGTNTFYNLQKNVTTAGTLTFESGASQTISNALTLTGQSGAILTLASSSGGSYWNVNPAGTHTLSYLSVSDSNNTGADINTAGLNIADGGHNVGWTFVANGTWTGGGADNNWSTPGNWSSGVPATSDVVVFDTTSTKSCIVDIPATVAGLNMATGFTGTITVSNGFTINGDATLNAGDFNAAGASTLDINGSLAIISSDFTAPTNAVMSISKSLTIDSTASWNFSGSGTLFFDASGTTKTITTNSKQLQNVRFDASYAGSTGTIWTLQDNFTAYSINVATTLANASLVDNGKTVTVNSPTAANITINTSAVNIAPSTGTWVMAANGTVSNTVQGFAIFEASAGVTVTISGTCVFKKGVLGANATVNGGQFYAYSPTANDYFDFAAGSNVSNILTLYGGANRTQKSINITGRFFDFSYANSSVIMSGDWTVGNMQLSPSAGTNSDTEAEARVFDTNSKNLTANGWVILGAAGSLSRQGQQKLLLRNGTHVITGALYVVQGAVPSAGLVILDDSAGSVALEVDGNWTMKDMKVTLGSASVISKGNMDYSSMYISSESTWGMNAGTSTITLSGAANQTITAANSVDNTGAAIAEFYNMVINKTGAAGTDKVIISSPANTLDLTVTNSARVIDGILDLATNSAVMTIGVALTIDTAGSMTVGAASTLTIAGTAATYKSSDIFSIANTTWASTATLNLQSDLDQTLPSDETYGNLQLGRYSDSGGTIYTMGSTIAGDWTVDSDATVELSGNLFVTGDVTINGQVNTNGFNMTVGGNLDIASGATLDASQDTGSSKSAITVTGYFHPTGNFVTDSTTLAIGAGTTAMKSPWSLGSITVASGAVLTTDGYNFTTATDVTVPGTLNAASGTGGASTLTVGGGVNLANGAFTGSDSTLILNASSGAQSFVTNNQTFNVIRVTGAGSWTVTGGLTTSSDFTMTAGTFNAASAGTMDVNGSLAVTGAFIAPSAVMSVAGSLTIDAATTWTSSSGILNFDASGSGKTITTNGKNLYNAYFTGSGDWTFNDSTTITNDFTLAAGTLKGGTSTISVGRNWDSSGATATFTYNQSTVDLTGTGQMKLPYNSYFYNLKIAAPGQTTTVLDPTSLRNFYIYGTLTLGSGTLTHSTGVYGLLFILRGTVTPLVYNNTNFVYGNMLIYNTQEDGYTFTVPAISTASNLAVSFTPAATVTYNLGGALNIGAFDAYQQTAGKTLTYNTNGFPITTSNFVRAVAGNGSMAYARGATIANFANSTVTDGWDAGTTWSSYAYSGTVNLESSVWAVSWDWTMQSSNGTITVNPGTSTVKLYNTCKLWSGGTSFNNLQILGNRTPYDNVSVLGSLYLKSFSFNCSTYNAAVTVAGAVTIDAGFAFTAGTAPFNISGPTAAYTNVNIAATTWTGGTLNIQTDLDQTLPSGETYGNLQLGRYSGSGGTIFTMGSTITGNWTVDADATVELSGNLTISGNATINGRVNTNGWNLTVGGNFDIASGGTLDASQDTGSTKSRIAVTGYFHPLGNFISDNTTLLIGAGTSTMRSAWSLGSITIAAGSTLVTDGYNFTTTSDVTVPGTLNAANGAGGSSTLAIGGSVNFTGGTFTNTLSTVILNSTTTAQTILTADNQYNVLTVSNSAAGGVTFSDAWTVVDFTDITAGSKLYFENGITYTISGTLTLNGTSGNLITLNTHDGLTTNFILKPAGGVPTVNYLSVRRADAQTNDITCVNCNDAGYNNSGTGNKLWDFDNSAENGGLIFGAMMF